MHVLVAQRVHGDVHDYVARGHGVLLGVALRIAELHVAQLEAPGVGVERKMSEIERRLGQLGNDRVRRRLHHRAEPERKRKHENERQRHDPEDNAA